MDIDPFARSLMTCHSSTSAGLACFAARRGSPCLAETESPAMGVKSTVKSKKRMRIPLKPLKLLRHGHKTKRSIAVLRFPERGLTRSVLLSLICKQVTGVQDGTLQEVSGWHRYR